MPRKNSIKLLEDRMIHTMSCRRHTLHHFKACKLKVGNQYLCGAVLNELDAVGIVINGDPWKGTNLKSIIFKNLGFKNKVNITHEVSKGFL